MTSLAPRAHVPLAPLTTLGVGGTARWFATAATAADVRASHEWCRERGVSMWVLGGGSNVVIADAGFDGLVMQVAIAGWNATAGGDELVVEVGAGHSWDAAVARLVAEDWAGAECLSGIPGTVGGTPIQNVGAYGQEVASIVDAVQVLDRESGDLVSLPADACGFGYRSSRFKAGDAGRYVICSVRFRVRRGEPTLTYPDLRLWLHTHGVAAPALGDARTAVLAIRRSKGMVADGVDPDAHSVGSFFMNPVLPVAERDRLERLAGQTVPARAAGNGVVRVPAAWLIERAGWARGDGNGPVGISTKHPLAIVNRGGATAADVVRFAARIKRGVVDRLGIWLQPEPVFVGFDAAPDLADLEYLRKAHP
jgi:UDP-N-acetylmuramate dehydrogenase